MDGEAQAVEACCRLPRCRHKQGRQCGEPLQRLGGMGAGVVVAVGEGVGGAVGASGRCLSGRAVEGERCSEPTCSGGRARGGGGAVVKRSDDGSASS